MADEVAAALQPMAVDGTLFKEDRDRVYQDTHCSVAVRQRGKWASRMLTVSGPPDRLLEVQSWIVGSGWLAPAGLPWLIAKHGSASFFLGTSCLGTNVNVQIQRAAFCVQLHQQLHFGAVTCLVQLQFGAVVLYQM